MPAISPSASGEGTPIIQTATYTFADTREATAFMTEAVEALMYLGCDVHAQ